MWKVRGMSYFCRSLSLGGKWSCEWQCGFVYGKQAFHWERKELVPSFRRATQGAFLSPPLSWEIATDVGYCEVSPNVSVKRLWGGGGGGALNSSKESWTPRAAGAPLLGESLGHCCPPLEGIHFLPEDVGWNRPADWREVIINGAVAVIAIRGPLSP